MAGKASFRGELLNKDLKDVREPAEGTVVCKGLRQECAHLVGWRPEQPSEATSGCE